MNRAEDSFLPTTVSGPGDMSGVAERRETGVGMSNRTTPGDAFPPPTVGRLHGFDLLDQPLISNVAVRAGELLTARTTVPLRRAMIGRDVLVVFDRGDAESAIIIGVIHADALDHGAAPPAPDVAIQVDGERRVIEAEREIVLRCGEASITLTRAGKVIIKGNYILSRSTGYNKIKGAAIDIN